MVYKVVLCSVSCGPKVNKVVLPPPSPRFGHSCGHHQGDFFDNRNTSVIKMCLNHSTVLKTINYFFPNLCSKILMCLMVQKIQYICQSGSVWLKLICWTTERHCNRTSTLITTNIQLPSSASSGSGESWDRRLTVHHRDEFHSGNICILSINQ